MGGTGSSSKRKSSKKKSSKNYSQISRKKKIRRNEYKKRRHRHDSVSSYSGDDDSINSASISTSSSESDYKNRKNKYKKIRRDYSISSDDNCMKSASESLSSPHNDYSRKAKSGSHRRRKGARERSISLDRNKDSLHVRKRKGLKKNHDVKTTKKSLKKYKKHTRVSSSSTDSQSCSTCRISRSERTTERERPKTILDKEIERARGRDARKVHRKRKVRSPSCSSCSRDNDHSVSQTEEVVATANSSRRLRSIITVVAQPCDKEEKSWETDPYKEEIVYNHDDFPSPRSTESDDLGRKGEADYQSRGVSNKKSRLETVSGEEVTKHSFTGMEGCDRKTNTVDTKSNEVDSNTLEKKRITDVSVTDLGGDDLESILRLKALENLRMFRGGLQPSTTANRKTENESHSNKFSSAGATIIQNKSTKRDSFNVACLTQEMNHSSMPTLERNLSHIKEIKKDITGHEDVGRGPITNNQNAIHPSDGVSLPIPSEEEGCSTAHAVITKPVSSTDPNRGAVVTNAFSSESSCVEPTSGEHTLKDPQNEAKDGSQFEQKRMSVMRGGEMVEVSYKVYIPKKASALTRRQLRR